MRKNLLILTFLSCGLLLSVAGWSQTYTYVVEEFNFTSSVATSEDGFRWQQFGLASEMDGTNEYDVTHNGYLRYEGDDEASERTLPNPVSSGVIHVYMTLAGFNQELLPDEEAAENDGAERSIAVQLVDNSSGSDVDITRLRFRSDF